MDNNLVMTHLWQEQGLGAAPFRAIDCITLPSGSLGSANPSAYNGRMAEAQQHAKRYGVALGTCYACGQGLINNVIIRDARGGFFVVGLDCARKTEDSKLIAQAELLEKNRQKTIREAKREAEYQARRAAMDAELNAQRERNGGLTDAEIVNQRNEEAARERLRRVTERNSWLVSVLYPLSDGGYGFVASMLDALTRTEAQFLSERQLAVLSEIYAKHVGGRKGSQKFNEAQEQFWAKVRDAAAA